MIHFVVAPVAALVLAAGAPPDTIPAGSVRPPLTPPAIPLAPVTIARDTARQGHAVDHSDAYYTRLTIHRYGSYAMLPIFGAEYLLGQQLLNGRNVGSWVKPTHVAVAATLGGLFAVNTVTGVWNLWESRKDPDARALRFTHAALLLAADAGFAITPVLLDDDNRSGLANARTLHRNVALTSMSLATLGTAIMWLRKE